MSNEKKKKVQSGTLRKVLRYIKKYWALLILSIVLAAVTVVGTLYLPILSGDAIDFMIDAGKVDFGALKPLLYQMVVIILITAVSQYIMSLCNNRMAAGVVRDMRNQALSQIEKLPLSYLDTRSYGDVVSRVIADADQFADGLLMGFTQLFTGVLTILGTLVFMFSVNVWIALVVVCITPVSLLVAAFIAKKTYTMFRLQSTTRGEQTALIDEMVGNQKIVQAFGRQEQAQSQFDEVNGRLQDCSLKAIFFSSITNPSTRFVNSLVYAAVGVFGALLSVAGGISVG